MSEETTQDRNSQLFLSLVTSMHMGAMFQMGKVASPMTGEIERNIPQAQYTIDLLGMLEVRTAGNLTTDEASLLNRTLSELRMNFIDESAKGANEVSDSEPVSDTSPDPSANGTGDESAEPNN